MTLKCEKQQVGALAEHLAGLLADLPCPAEDEVVAADVDFVEPAGAGVGGRAHGRGLGRGRRPLVLLCEEIVAVDEDDEPASTTSTPASARFRLTRAQVAAFVEIARELVAAGRPPCYLCGLPMDPTGHACPGSN